MDDKTKQAMDEEQARIMGVEEEDHEPPDPSEYPVLIDLGGASFAEILNENAPIKIFHGGEIVFEGTWSAIKESLRRMIDQE